jgi:hypothetical protein
MKKISNTTKITGLISIGLWIIASILLFPEKNGKAIFVSTAVIIIAGLSSQIIKTEK